MKLDNNGGSNNQNVQLSSNAQTSIIHVLRDQLTARNQPRSLLDVRNVYILLDLYRIY